MWRKFLSRKTSSFRAVRLMATEWLVVLTSGVAISLLAPSYIAAQETPTDNQKTAVEQPATADQQADRQVSSDRQYDAAPAASERSKLKVSWDNTFKYDAGFRVQGQNRFLISADPTSANYNGYTPNLDDGDRAFNPGLISDRLDILSEIDVQYGGWGIRASGSAWGDQAYYSKSDNKPPSLSFNPFSVSSDQFSRGVRDLCMAHIELLDAFAFGRTKLANRTLTLRGGQFAQYYGETLFFGSNGIAGGMAPFDVLKLLSAPSSQFKELIRPVPQVSFNLQLSEGVSVGAYYQLGWEQNRLAPAGSYYSFADLVDEGAERLWVPYTFLSSPGNPNAFYRGKDRYAKNSGQFGAQIRFRPGHGWDMGVYGIQFHDKNAQIYADLGDSTYSIPLGGDRVGTFGLVYPENIKAFGISATKTFGSFNVAAELSGRLNQDLVSDLMVINLFANEPLGDNNKHPHYAVGDTLHGNINWIASLGKSPISKEASWLGELAWNNAVSITKNPTGSQFLTGSLDPNTTKNAVGFRTTYTPTYRQVFSATDISVPVGFSFFPMGKSRVFNPWGADKGGDYNVGVEVAYRDAWRLGVVYNGYYGKVSPFVDKNGHYNFQQLEGDRGSISITLRKTFGLRYSGRTPRA